MAAAKTKNSGLDPPARDGAHLDGGSLKTSKYPHYAALPCCDTPPKTGPHPLILLKQFYPQEIKYLNLWPWGSILIQTTAMGQHLGTIGPRLTIAVGIDSHK